MSVDTKKKFYTITYVRDGVIPSWNQSKLYPDLGAATDAAKKKTSKDRDGDEYYVFEAVAMAKSPIPSDVEVVKLS